MPSKKITQLDQATIDEITESSYIPMSVNVAPGQYSTKRVSAADLVGTDTGTNLVNLSTEENQATNNTTMLKQQITSLVQQRGGVIELPAGTFYLDDVISITVTQKCPITIVGQGQETTSLVWKSNTNGFDIDLPDDDIGGWDEDLVDTFITIKHMSLKTTTQGAHTAIIMDNTGAVHQGNLSSSLKPTFVVDHVTFVGENIDQGWNIGIDSKDCHDTIISNCFYRGAYTGNPADGETALCDGFIKYDTTINATNHRVTSCNVYICEYGVSLSGNGEGYSIEECTFVLVWYGVVGDAWPGLTNAKEPGVNITNCHIACVWCCVFLNHYFQVNITNNLLYVRSDAASEFTFNSKTYKPAAIICEEHVSTANITDNQVWIEPGARDKIISYFTIHGSNTLISHNTFSPQLPDVPKILLQAESRFADVKDNKITDSDVDAVITDMNMVSNLGSNNTDQTDMLNLQSNEIFAYDLTAIPSLSSQATVVESARNNALLLQAAVDRAARDRTQAEIKLPPGRIYLDRQIVVDFSSVSNFDDPNAITIQGRGQGTTSLCWINDADTYGIKVNLGPDTSSTHHQYITIRDVDFVQGNAGNPAFIKNISNITRSSPAVVTVTDRYELFPGQRVIIENVNGMTQVNNQKYYAVTKDANSYTQFELYHDVELTSPVNSTGFSPYTDGGVLDGDGSHVGVRGVAIEINGDSRETPVAGHTGNFDKQVSDRTVTSALVQNCSFQGWSDSFAGWNKCILYNDSHESDIKHCNFRSYIGSKHGATGTSVWWQGEAAVHITGDAKPTNFYLNQLRFWGWDIGIKCDGNMEGVQISQGSWVNTRCGIHWRPEALIDRNDPNNPSDDETFEIGSGKLFQWPLLVVTDCHMNCMNYNINIEAGWQVLIKGCSFYGVQVGTAYGVPTTLEHRSILIDHQSSNCNIYGNTFSDTSTLSGVGPGALGPSIECDGHMNMIHGNTFTIDSANLTGPGIGPRDEPHVLLTSRASGNVVQNNMCIKPLNSSLEPPEGTNGINYFQEQAENISLLIEDNNTGAYNNQLIVKNHVINNGTDTDLSPIGTQLHRTTHMDYGKGDYYGNPIHHGRFEIQRTGELTNGHAYTRETATPWNQNDTYNTGDEVVILQTEPTSAMSIGTSAFFVAQQDGLTGTLSNPLSSTSTGQWKWTTSSVWPNGNDEVSPGFVGFPANYAGTKAPMVVQLHHDTDIGPYPEPGVVYDFEATGGGEVNTELEYSNSIFWGVYSNTRKYNNGSGHSFTANTQLHEHPPLTGYNEAACYTGEVINHGAARGTMSGVEVRCVDSADPQDPNSFSADTKMISVIGRMHRSFDGERLNHCFAASSEGPVPVDSMLKALTSPEQFPHVGTGAAGFKEGIDMSGVDFTTKGALIVPEGHELKGADSSGTRYSVMRPGADKSNPFEVWVDNQWKKVEIGPVDSGGPGYRALRVLN